jgi:hypothetical protein
MDVFALTMRLKEEGAAQVKASVDKLNRSFKDAETNATSLDRAFSGLQSQLKNFATVAAVGAFLNKVIDETSAAQFAQAQLQAALKSTGNVAGQSVTQVNAMASALQETTVFADDAVTAAQSLLLTFTKVGGETFPRATKAIADVAQAMGTDLKSATIQVGKALQDPIMGVTALSRAGIQFSDAQKEMIKQMVETNRLADAQSIVLKELETQFGGSAEAAGKTLGGAIERLKNSFGDLFEISESASEGVVDAIEFMISALKGLNTVLTSMRQALQLFGLNAGVLFEEVKAFLTMSGDEYRAYMKVLKQYEEEQEAIILGLKSEETATRGVAAATGALNSEKAAELALDRQLNALKPMGSLERMVAPRAGAAIQAVVGPAQVMPNQAALASLVDQNSSKFLDMAVQSYQQRIDELAFEIKFALGDTLGNAIADGLETAIREKSIGAGFKALGKTLVSGLGDMMIQFGKASLIASTLMDTIFKALAKALPGGAIVASLAMIAAGAALKGAAGSAFGGGRASSGGGGGGGYSAPMASSGSMAFATQYYGPTAAGSANTIERINPVSVTIIGPNDPAAQRQMQELIRNANRRGSV